MKQTISTPLAVGIVVIVVLIVGFFFWQRYNGASGDAGASNQAVTGGARTAHMRGAQGASDQTPSR